MKQALLAAVLFGATLQAQAAYQDVVKAQAKQVQGATSCEYAVIEGSMSENSPQEIVIYVNSDVQSHVNGSIRLSPDMLPLQEGRLMTREGLILEYKDGVLTQFKKQTTEGPFVNDYTIVKIKVSADLQEVEAGYVKKATKGLFSEKVLGEMSCRF